MTMCQY